ncbi:hypothetical protein [Prescottella sp. R16]|uniref:hypothetical protein n=1 Tax=Prescottella sp. R16 TaxID=3064529 RepID=UPI00272DCA28|nr:hypothetical protein [Prescottella sp. R16]
MLLVSVVAGVPAAAQSTGSGVLADGVGFETLCTPTDPALEELSGLAAVSDTTHGDVMYGIGDSGTDDTVTVLDDTCRVTGSLPVPVDPYDIEDMGIGPDGRLWLSDTGDNLKTRSTVALIDLDPATGAGGLHRLTYPDGPHDAETLLIGRDGVPLIVTKDVLVASGIYRPVGGAGVDGLASPGPTPLERVGQVRLGPTATPGGPVPIGGSTLITGGAVSADGTVAALRTYTDVYLYSAPDGDLVRALTTTTPVRVPIPDEPQGEALAFTPDDALIAGSEAAGGPLPPLRVLPGAVEIARGAAPAPSSTGSVVLSASTDDAPAAPDDAPGSPWALPVLAIGGAVAATATYWSVRRRSGRGRH